jgi:deoxyadenosine/deoxycytidine kinase
MQQNIDVVLEGNIAVGKTTLLEILESLGIYEIVREPVELWSNAGVLEKFYADPKKYGFVLQSFTFVSRLLESCKKRDKNVRIIERDIEADKNIFAKLNHISGNINDTEWAVYEKIFDMWGNIIKGQTDSGHTGVIGPVKTVIVYLRSSPEDCYERILKRKRTGENKISLDYLKLLHNAHEEWLSKRKDVVIIDIKNWTDFTVYKKYIVGKFKEIIENAIK